ncbi:Brp/Blh family beta-carotene 15,15'-dioxygenase [Roseicyclus sp.]|uniref:Brp/Blh family beta-carotene 15,15'-dioxygenase n=1 Tax=Roseicyclus sp. TaxID=1914329 RepID=UPI001BCAE563|nr:Brp/Blh family beta-carotene 15,15'-dioxygenase [Roseicyclus sp.]
MEHLFSAIATGGRGKPHPSGSGTGPIWVAALALPPLLFFIVCFCGLHSVRHFTQTLQSVPKSGQAVLISAVPSCTVVVIAGIAWVLLPQTDVQLSLQIVFIGLAALTVPDMLLVDRLHRQG